MGLGGSSFPKEKQTKGFGPFPGSFYPPPPNTHTHTLSLHFPPVLKARGTRAVLSRNCRKFVVISKTHKCCFNAWSTV